MDPSLLPTRLNALAPAAQIVARLIATCRGPLRLDDLKGIAAGTDAAGRLTDRDVSEALTSLADGALIAVDSHGDSALFAMPDAVREEVRARLDTGVLTMLVHAAYDHFLEAVPVEGPRDLPRAVQLFHLLIELGEVLAAAGLFRQYIYEPLLFRNRDARHCAALLERLLGEGRETRLLLVSPRELSMALNALGLAYQADGRPEISLPPLGRARIIDDRAGEVEHRVITLRNLARGMLDSGRLRDSEGALDAGSSLAASAGLEGQRRFLLVELWGARALRGLLDPGLLQEASSLSDAAGDHRVESVVRADQAAKGRDLVEEIPALLALVELRLRSGQSEAAATHLKVARERLAGSGYRLFEADYQVRISRWEQAAGRLPRAVEAAARAYELSWCDGPPYVYHWGLVAARRQLSALGAAEPGGVDPSLGTYGARRWM
jgi:hypothetical protein